MNTVKELNKLAEKMVGENPKSRLDAEAIKYIQDNYEGGGSSSSKFDYIITFNTVFTADENEHEITDSSILAVLNAIKNDNSKYETPLNIGLIYITAQNNRRFSICTEYGNYGTDLNMRFTINDNSLDLQIGDHNGVFFYYIN